MRVMGIYESGTPEQKAIRAKFRAMIRSAFAPAEIRELAHIAAVGMLPADDPPPPRPSHL